MGTDTQQKIQAIDDKAEAANEAVNLVKTEVSKLWKFVNRHEKHIVAEERAEAAKAATYKKNFYNGE